MTDLLHKHYRVMLAALNDIKDVINTDPCTYTQGATVADFEAVLRKIEDIAGQASTVDLFNPHNRPGEAERLIGEMEDQP
jgi:hypothetical protein